MNDLKPFNSGLDEGSWRTQNFRQSVVAKIDESIQRSGMPTSRNSIEMENHVFQKAKSRDEYLSMVARLILHVRDINTKKGAIAGGPGTPQSLSGLPGGPSGSQENPGGAPNPNQGGNGNQTGPGGNQGAPTDPINALQNLASQGSRNNNMGPQGQMQVPQNNMVPGNQMGSMQNQMGQQGPMGQQGVQQQTPILGGTLLLTRQQFQNKMGPGMGMVPNQNPMGPGQMNSNQLTGQMMNQLAINNQLAAGGMQGQMNNPNMPGQNPMNNPMGGNNPMAGQMAQNQMAPNMTSQMVGPGQMSGQMSNMGGGQMNMLHMQQQQQQQQQQQLQQRKTGDAMAGMMGSQGGVGGGFQTGGGRGGGGGSHFLRQSPSPSAPSPAAMGGPSPASMGLMGGPMASPMSVGSGGLGGGVGVGVSSGGGGSPALAPSPSSAHHPQQQQLHPQQIMQQHRCGTMAPSPSSSLNTPLGAGAAPSPVGVGSGSDENTYREKVRQLSKYIEPLRRMISRMITDGENVDKLTKMKNFLDILSHPLKRMPLETLLKCEVVLEKLDFKRSEGMSLHSQSNPLHLQAKEHQIFCPLLEVVNNALQSPVANHTLKRTFGPCVEALFGPEIRNMPPPLKKTRIEEPNPDIPDVLQGEIARLDSRFKVSLEGLQVGTGSGAVRLVAQLEDSRLPCVPPVSLSVPRDYPDSPPTCLPPSSDYAATPFLRRVGAALGARLAALPRKFSLSQLLDTWEMSVRQACSPQSDATPHSSTTLLIGI